MQNDYEEISANCRKIASGLLNEVRTSEEVGLLLSRDHGPELGVSQGGAYPRLTLAIAFEQKEASCMTLILNDLT